ncbi:MAG: DUF5681 domain-containing protein [Micropepsaceae bacterium]
MARRNSETPESPDPSSRKADNPKGYGNPPKEHQFKPGKSGNPKGRPRGTVKLAGILGKAIQEQRVVTVGGRKTTMSNMEIMVRKTMEKANGGDAKSFSLMMNLLAEHNPELLAELRQRTLEAEDQELLKDFLTRHNPKPTVTRKENP